MVQCKFRLPANVTIVESFIFGVRLVVIDITLNMNLNYNVLVKVLVFAYMFDDPHSLLSNQMYKKYLHFIEV